MKVLGIVPARAGSKRVPNKNLRELGGKALAARAIEACLDAHSLSKVVVSSDSAEVLSLARRYAGVVTLQRPDQLATDTSLAIEYVSHALDALEDGRSFDAIAIVQPSSPFTLAVDIEQTIGLLARHPEADSAVTVVEVEHALHPAKLKQMKGDDLVALFEEEHGRMAAHELPKVFVRNCSVYVSRRSTIETKHSVLGDRSVGMVMPRERSLDINDELDFQFAQFLLAQQR